MKPGWHALVVTMAVAAGALSVGCGSGGAAEEPDLPRVTTVGAAPEDLSGAVAVLTVLRSGALALDGAPLPFADLGARLGAAARVEPTARGPRCSDVHLVIRADRRVPWRTVQWLAQEAAARGLSKLLFGVLPPAGSGEGTFAVFLPADRGRPDPKLAPRRPFRVRLSTDGWWDSTPLALYAAVLGDPRDGLADLDAAPDVATGSVLLVADLLLRAGVRHLALSGTRPPKPGEVPPPGPEEVPPCYVTLDGEPVRAPGAAAGPPPAPRVAGLAGFLDPWCGVGKPVEEEPVILEEPPEPR